MLGLAFFTTGGLCFTTVACINGETPLPLISLLLGFMALMIVCTCDLLHFDTDMPGHLMDDDQGRVTRSDLGWWLCGIFITGAWALPLIIARHEYLNMRNSWFASLGTWFLVATLGLFIMWLSKGQQRDSWAY